MMDDLIKRRMPREDTDTQGERHALMEAEIGVTWLHAKEVHLKLGSDKEGSYPESQRQHDPADILISDL